MIEFVVYEMARDRVAERARGALANSPVLADDEEVQLSRQGARIRRRTGEALRWLADRVEPAPHGCTTPVGSR